MAGLKKKKKKNETYEAKRPDSLRRNNLTWSCHNGATTFLLVFSGCPVQNLFNSSILRSVGEVLKDANNVAFISVISQTIQQETNICFFLYSDTTTLKMGWY